MNEEYGDAAATIRLYDNRFASDGHSDPRTGWDSNQGAIAGVHDDVYQTTLGEEGSEGDEEMNEMLEGVKEDNREISVPALRRLTNSKIIKNAGGDINRMKGNVDSCKKFLGDVRFLIQGSLQENLQKAKEKNNGPQFDDDDEIEEIQHFTTKDGKSGSSASSKGKRKIGEMTSFFKYGVQDSKQPSIKACVQSKERWHVIDMAIALWFYDACIPTNAVNSPFFQKAVDKIASMGHGYKAPNYHALRVNLLRDAKTQIKLIIDSFRSHWAEVRCTIMGDGWTDTRQRPLINFLVYCSKGLSFTKFVDASNFITDAETLCNLFAEIVEFVGPNNVVHIVTDNGANYKAAGRKLSERYPTIRWSPCAAHCINLIMKDMLKMNDVKNVATLASNVTVFIYDHKWTLN
ncbi:uncharacterized protein LOC127791597 [Diospyros lotus]|uniref:uncharacterized protein LOC127791597 n=1 Tax=Diospyros lotus TaxID=55363 RepID=UPI00225613FF|nr:uncharacterized protein LOC127791597 [Diospyros lotus]